MCRYSEHEYKTSWACFHCRKSFNKPRYGASCHCPECGRPMKLMGRDFQAPRKRNKRAWRVVQRLRRAGIKFDSCGCGGPGYRPRRPWEVEGFLR
jgi:DNA-directed RNA polymerase subunit RPC12/RpoP